MKELLLQASWAKRLSQSGFKRATNLFLTQGCPVCDRPTAQTFCPDCERQIYAHSQPDKLGEHRDAEGNCVLPVSALGRYRGPLKRAILAMKYGDRPEVAGPLGAALARQWLSHQKPTSPNTHPKNSGGLYAVPIPLHADRQKSRGFNQAELIAQTFCQVSRLPLLAHGLVRVHATKPQHELGLLDRQQNLEQVFQVGQSLHQIAHRLSHRGAKNPTVLLVDDIYTTGATVQSAVDTLKKSRIAVVGIATVARAGL